MTVAPVNRPSRSLSRHLRAAEDSARLLVGSAASLVLCEQSPGLSPPPSSGRPWLRGEPDCGRVGKEGATSAVSALKSE